MQDEVGVTIYRTAKYKLISLLEESGVKILTGHAMPVVDGGVELKNMKTGDIENEEAEIVVMALGTPPTGATRPSLKMRSARSYSSAMPSRAAPWRTPRTAAYENCWYF